MTREQEEIPDVSMTNTKKEMPAAYKELVEEIGTVEKELEQREKTELLSQSGSLIRSSIPGRRCSYER